MLFRRKDSLGGSLGLQMKLYKDLHMLEDLESSIAHKKARENVKHSLGTRSFIKPYLCQDCLDDKRKTSSVDITIPSQNNERF